MPSDDLLPRFQRDLVLERALARRRLHYARTAEAWLEPGREPRRGRARLARPTGRARSQSWRVFFLACAELWGYRGGREWLVSHYRFAKRPT